jgi:hypothetical protein
MAAPGPLEESLAGLCTGCGLLPPRLLRTPALLLSSAGLLAAAGIRLRRRRAVFGSQLDFETDDFIPYRIAAVAFRNGEEFAQAATRVRGLGVEGLCLGRLLWSGLFVVHGDIIL